MKNWIVFILFILLAKPLFAADFEQTHYECFESLPGQALCEEIDEIPFTEEEVLIVPFSIKFDDEKVTLLSAQITSKEELDLL